MSQNIRFSLEHLTTLPWSDAADYTETFLNNTNNLSICSPDFVQLHILGDMNLLLDRALRASKILAQNGHLLLQQQHQHQHQQNSATTTIVDLDNVSRALEQFLQLIRHTFEASQGNLALAFEADNFRFFRQLKIIFTECLLKTVSTTNDKTTTGASAGVVAAVIPLWISSSAATSSGNNITLSRSTAARRTGFELLQTLAELPAFKDIMAEELFIPLFHFISLAPVGIDEPHEDDFASRRLCAQVITSAIRSSKKVKSYVINHRLLEKIVPLLRDTPTGDFFLQVQTFEIIYRVTRQGPHIIDSLNLPEVIATPIRQANSNSSNNSGSSSSSSSSSHGNNNNTNPLGDSENFVINLMKILDLYNSQRARGFFENNNITSSAASLFDKSCPIFSFTVDSYDITAEEASSFSSANQQQQQQQQHQQMGLLRNSASTTTNNSSKIPLCKMTQETKVLFSPRMCCLLIPGMNGLNHSFTLRQLSTLRISREHNLLITFKKVDRNFMKYFFGFSDSVISDFDEFDSIVSRCCCGNDNNNNSNGQPQQQQIAFNLALEPQVGSDLRQSPVQGWVKSAFELKKKFIVAAAITSNNNNNNNNNIQQQRPQTATASPVPVQQQQRQNQQQQQQSTAGSSSIQGFGTVRDPNQQQQQPQQQFVAPQKQQQQQQSNNSGGSGGGAPPSLTNMFGNFGGNVVGNNNSNNNFDQQQPQLSYNNNNNFPIINSGFPSMVRLSVSMPNNNNGMMMPMQEQQYSNNHNLFDSIAGAGGNSLQGNNNNNNSNGGFGFSNISVSSMMNTGNTNNINQQPQQMGNNNNNNNNNGMMNMNMNMNRGRSTSQQTNCGGSGASALLAQQLESKLHQMAREKSSRTRQAGMELLQQALAAIQTRRNEVEQQNRHDREAFNTFVRHEVQILRNAASMAKDRAASEGTALNNELKQLEHQSRLIQEDANKMKELLDSLASSMDEQQHQQKGDDDSAAAAAAAIGTSSLVQKIFSEKYTTITRDIEAALYECYEKIDQISAQTVLPQEFVKQFFV